MPIDDKLKRELVAIGDVLAKRRSNEAYLDAYYEGDAPFPSAIKQARVTKAYRTLVGVSSAPWGSLIVDSVTDRLEVTGISSGDKSIDDALWEMWQQNSMDAESKLAHNASLVSGRSFALVWPDPDTGEVEICLENSSQMAVRYKAGNRRKRQSAMRYWIEGGVSYAALYLDDGIYKFKGPEEDSSSGTVNFDDWEQYQPADDDEWPVSNPWNLVPVIELPVNRRLKPGQFGFARGEFEHVTSLIDRINLLTFLGLVVAFYMGFPLRGVIGEKIRREVLKDDDGNPIVDAAGEQVLRQIPLFDAQAGGMFQLENPNAELAEYKAAERGLLGIYPELDQLSALTKTPRHYLPLAQGMTNLSADAIRASEGSLVAKIPTHKASLGEGWEETLRVGGYMLDTEVELPQTAELQWSDHETRSLAERADAAVKLKDIIPNAAIIEYVLNATSEQMARWESQRSGDVLSQILTAATTPAPTIPATVAPVPVPSNGASGG